MAGLMIMGMYRQQILELEAATRAAGMPMVSATGPASILTAFPGADQNNLGYLFL
jgi:hypothetical protein